MRTELINRYRPASFAEVVGNESVVNALRDAVVSSACPHAFLLTGPSGVGKTTLARIIASKVQATVEELDAASHSGIEHMRGLVEAANFQPIMGTKNKMIILDECHGLSKPAWQSILKLLEEPPSYLFIALATTELNKIPDSIKTRCYHAALKALRVNEIEDFVGIISELEGWTVQNDVFSAIVQASTGQPRKALTILQAGHAATSREELAAIIAEVEKESSALTELCRFLLAGGKDWGRISKLLSEVEDDEDSLAQGSRYLFQVMVSGSEGNARAAWRLLDALSFPRVGYDKKVQLGTAIGAFLGWGA